MSWIKDYFFLSGKQSEFPEMGVRREMKTKQNFLCETNKETNKTKTKPKQPKQTKPKPTNK